MSEEANGAAGLVAEIERLRTDNAELRASAELIHRQWRSMVAERAGLRTQLALANAENATLRVFSGREFESLRLHKKEKQGEETGTEFFLRSVSSYPCFCTLFLFLFFLF